MLIWIEGNINRTELLATVLQSPSSRHATTISEPAVSPDIGSVVAGRTSGVKIPWGAWLGLLLLSSV